MTLEERDAGTLLTLSHSNVPEAHVGYEQGGWQKQYFEPMIAYFSGEPSTGGEAEKGPRPLAERPRGRAATPTRRARLKRPAANKKAAASKARLGRRAEKKKAAAPKQGRSG